MTSRNCQQRVRAFPIQTL